MRNRNHARNVRRRPPLSAIEPLEGRCLLSATPELIADLDSHHVVPLSVDLNTDTFTTPFATSGPALVVDGTLFFGATDAVSGKYELLATPTGGATTVVTTLASPVGAMVGLGSNLFFSSGAELWKSDGTAAGTVMVKDINPVGLEYSGDHMVFDGELFFEADDGVDGFQLWKSDGTAAGTVMVDNTELGGDAVPYAEGLKESGGLLYFQAGTSLWRTDGTASGTLKLFTLDDPLGFGFSPFYRPPYYTGGADVNGTLFFTTVSEAGVPELWKSDGTVTGTVEVMEFPGAFGPIDPIGNLTNVNGTLMFSVDFENPGLNYDVQLWKSDGTAAGTVMVSDFSGGIYLYDFTPFNGSLYFAPRSGALWESDGTSGGTAPVSGSPPAAVGNLTPFEGDLYFTSGSQLWRTDGTDADLLDPYFGGFGDQLIPGNGELYAIASGGFVGGWNPFAGGWNGGEGQTEPFFEGYYDPDGFVVDPVVFGDALFFEDVPNPEDIPPINGSRPLPRLWIACGQAADPLESPPTTVVPFNGFTPADYGSNPTGFTQLNGKAYFLASDESFLDAPFSRPIICCRCHRLTPASSGPPTVLPPARS